jgi:beta-glucosidase
MYFTKTLSLLLTSFLWLNTISAQTPQQKAKALVKKLSLREKVGQMTQINFNVIAKGGWQNVDGTIDEVALKTAVEKYGIGSILNSVDHAYDVTTWRKIITQIQDATKNTPNKIPVIYGLDGMHGQTYTLNSTLFPHNLAIAATRNPTNAYTAAQVTAAELRASGVRWNYAPVLDCGRQPYWSRFGETYGEDVFIGKTFGVAAVKGYEEDGLTKSNAVASCMKHFVAYSASRTGKDRTPIYLPEIELREYYLPQFKAAIEAGSSTIMINSADINGEPVHASKYLLQTILRKELGFKGMVVSDWEDVVRLYTKHKVAATPRQAVVLAVNAGIDMSMVPYDYSFFDLLVEAVEKGEVTMTRIDEAVENILTLKFKTGLIDNPYPEDNLPNFGQAKYQQISYTAAQEAMTLLKNKNNILPLAKNTRVLVAGPSAQSISALNGCWSYTWQGQSEKWYPADSKTILQTITEKVGAANVFTSTIKGFDAAENYSIPALLQQAEKADVIVLCIGENAYAETPGNLNDLALAKEQTDLVKAAQATGKPVILVLTTGRPRLITDIEPLSSGILMAYWSGKKSAEAIADVLFGDYNPGGRLPFSYPRYAGEVLTYDRKFSDDLRETMTGATLDGYNPLFAFGHGLSYTTFSYSNLQLSSATISSNQKIQVTVTVKNTGNKAGMHSIELYSKDMVASIVPSTKRLRAFTKHNFAPGESKAITFTLSAADLAFVNAQLKTVTEPGTFEVMVGDLKAMLTVN